MASSEIGAPFVLNARDREAAISFLERYRDDCAGFARAMWGPAPCSRHKPRTVPGCPACKPAALQLWSGQVVVLRAVSGPAKKIAVRSGHKCGKTTCDAIVGLWWFCTRRRARVIFTAPTGRQVRSVLWREMQRLHKSARVPIGGRLYEVPDRGLRGETREMIGFSATDVEAAAGFSSPAMLYVVDEASGVPDALFGAIMGNRAGGNSKVLMTSNPTRTSGYYFDAFHAKRSEWATVHLSSRVAARLAPRGLGLASEEWIDEMRGEWGEGSPSWAVRVEGDFPAEGENAVVNFHALAAAVEAWKDAHVVAVEGEADEWGALVETPPNGLELGVDVARFGGDESVIAPVRGIHGYALRAFRGLDTTQLAGRIVETLRDPVVGQRHDERVRIKVDVGGGYGGGVVDRLNELELEGVEVVSVNGAESSSVEDRDGRPVFANLRAQVLFAVRGYLKRGGTVPPDARLEAELLSPTYKYNGAGRIIVEPKDEISKRLKRSPDRGDAFSLAVYDPPPSNAEEVMRERTRFSRSGGKGTIGVTRFATRRGSLAHLGGAWDDDDGEDEAD